MRELALEIPAWKLCRRVEFQQAQHIQNNNSGEMYHFVIRGREHSNIHVSILKSVEIKLHDEPDGKEITEVLSAEPFLLRRKEPITSEIKVTLHFMGNYYEPPLELSVQVQPEQSKIYELEYNLFTRAWEYREEGSSSSNNNTSSSIRNSK